jgi:hypothetical protein
MSKNWTKSVRIVLVAVLGLATAVGAARASCLSLPIQHGLVSTSFEQCGANAAAFVWFHGRGVQRIISDGGFYSGNTPAGHDSGRNQTLADYVMLEGLNGAANGSYYGQTDYANPYWDGCILNIPENPLGCGRGQDYGVLDYVISGVDPLSPNVARIALLSVDFNEFFQFYALDNAGAPAVDGDACVGDPFSFLLVPVNCAPIPAPTLVSSSGDDLGVNVTLGLGDTSGLPILDDCAIAETRSTNCPRNLYAGRVLVYKRGTCAVGEVSTFDRRVYLYPPAPAFGTTAVDANWRMLSPEDQNYNEVLDAGEDGSNGGLVNGQLDRILASGTSPTTLSFRVSRVHDSLNCLYFGMAIGLDANHLNIDPPPSTLFGEMVLSPMVSVNPAPVMIGAEAPTPDFITDLTATKTSGGVKVQWITPSENATAGFDVLGLKKNGRENLLNSTLIPAKEGTTGRGALYSVTFDSGQLKGCKSIAVELVGTDESRTRFGPVGF